MGRDLPEDVVVAVKSSAGLVAAHAMSIASRLYERLFLLPEIRGLFDPSPQRTKEQAARFAIALVAFAEHVDRLDEFEDAIRRIALIHVARGVRPEHYEQVGICLLAALRDVMDDAFDGVLEAAWVRAYRMLAALLVEAEGVFYRSGQGPKADGADEIAGDRGDT